MQELWQLVDAAARGNTSVLIRGETGAGKEIVARQLHLLSARRKGPFIAINCGAIPADLLESE
ncbi:MAG: sigma 54-interacting transcriptional regulator, partial [SAR86 cluster bacterium]|nr:sigma 54-interacting transcriptional regulator [SAR86 cluster bacterium]